MKKIILRALLGTLIVAGSALWIMLWGRKHWTIPELAAGGLALALAAVALYY